MADASYSYHCLCSTFILATKYDLASLPARKGSALDKAIILPLRRASNADEQSILQNIVPDQRPTVIRREDGFEKRILLRCQRCDLVLGYNLDQAHYKNEEQKASDIAYILPGGLLPTEDLMEGKMPQEPEWAVNSR